jgi:SnoaL-like domain
MSSVQTGLQELLDKQAITEAIYRYARAMDRLDRDLGYSVFWPEATADYDKQMYQGTGHGFVDMCMDAHPTFHSHSHQFSNILITVNGDTATSETYGDVTLRQVVDDGTYVDMRNLGRYIDRWGETQQRMAHYLPYLPSRFRRDQPIGRSVHHHGTPRPRRP